MNAARVIRRNRRTHSRGMTLIEVMIASAMLFLVTGGLIFAVVTGSRINYASAQHVAAFSLCKDRLEVMRGMEYTNITALAFPTETITLTHAGGTLHAAVPCTRATTIIDRTDPVRKDVTIAVTWDYARKNLAERIDTTIYFKE